MADYATSSQDQHVFVCRSVSSASEDGLEEVPFLAPFRVRTASRMERRETPLTFSDVPAASDGESTLEA